MQILDNICESVVRNIKFDLENSCLIINLEHRSTKNHWQLNAFGVLEFVGWDFKFTNIAQELIIYSGAVSSLPRVKELVFGVLKGRGREIDELLSSPRIEEILQKIATDQLKIALLEAVFGCEMIILAKKIELLKL
jgi:hypothetical protein